jgi:CHAT domain-containing protein
MGPARPFEGRLAGVRSYQPFAAPSSPPGLRPTSTDALAEIGRLAREERAAGRLRATAVLELLLGNNDVAVATLTEALARDRGSADNWNDLAVAYLAVAARTEASAEALARALDAAATAASLAPQNLEPLFNLGLAATQLNLTRTASDAWSRAIAMEQSSEWRSELTERRGRLTSHAVTSWNEQRALLLDPGIAIAAQDLGRIATTYPQAVKELIYDALLARWARTWIDGRESDAGVMKDRIVALADSLEQLDGDRLPRLCAANFATTLVSRHSQALAQRLASAHIAYAEGREWSEQNRRELAGQRFAAAAAGFAAAGSPCEAWATIQMAVTHYQNRELDKAARLAQPVKDRALANGFRSLFARTQWLLGLVYMQRQEMEMALPAYDDAMRAYEQAREDENALVVAGAAADALRVMGEHGNGWTFLSRALRRLERVASDRRRYVLLLNASLYASDEELPRAAMLFQNESLEAARARGVPNTLVEGLVRRARLHLSAGDRSASRRDLDEATRLLPDVAAQSSRQYQQSWLDRIRGEWLAAEDPQMALTYVERALAGFTRYEPAEVPAVYLARGRIALRGNNLDEAEDSFRRGAIAFDARWHRLTVERNRVSYLDEGWDLFDELIHLRAITQRNPDAAFQEAEQARARVLAAAAGTPPLTLDAVKQRLSKDALLLYYVTVGDQLLVWAVTSERTNFRALNISHEELTRLINAYRGLIEAGRSSEDVLRLGRQLFEQLVAPTLPAPPPTGTWFVVPDGALHALPFAALVDPTSGRFLVEDRDVAILPSARFLSQPSSRGTNAGATSVRALAIGGAPTADPTLPRLPDVPGELRDVATSYSNTTILEGTEATPRRFNQLAGSFDVIHFAGHARANSRVPWSSYLVLAPDAEHPLGFLPVSELSGLHLHGVQLVVLAACETVSGNVYRGEGPVSLARPFLAAGATAVLGTLWSVDDRSTRTFVRAFHREFAREHDAPRALRQAQRVLLASRDASDRLPRAWAAFVIIGSPLTQPEK